MTNNKKLLMLAVGLFVFAATKFGILWWWQKQQPDVQDIACADIRAGCMLPDGSKLQFSGQVGLKTPFDVTLHGSAAQKVSLSFAMRDMDMGFNRYDLRAKNGVWQAQNIRLPLCTEARHDFLAEISADGKVYRVPFRAE